MTWRIISRILCFPFIGAIYLISGIIFWFRCMYLYVRYGGETLIYNRPNMPANLSSLADAVQEMVDRSKESDTAYIDRIKRQLVNSKQYDLAAKARDIQKHLEDEN